MNAQGGATLLVDRVDEDANDELEHKETRHYDPQVKKDDVPRHVPEDWLLANLRGVHTQVDII